MAPSEGRACIPKRSTQASAVAAWRWVTWQTAGAIWYGFMQFTGFVEANWHASLSAIATVPRCERVLTAHRLVETI